MKTYNVVNDIAFHSETDQKVIDVLTCCFNQRIRIRVYYGDVKTGLSWLDEYDVTGYVGRSTGSYKIPLLIYNSLRWGGGAMLDHCIVRIVTTAGKTVLYSHPNFHTPELKIVDSDLQGYDKALLTNGSVHARGTVKQMSNLCKALAG